MKRKITFLIAAAVMLIGLIVQPMRAVGQTRANLVLTFSFTSNPNTWPTTNPNSTTDVTYTLNSTSYTFNLNTKACYNSNQSCLFLTGSGGALGMPAISGYKLVKVEATNTSGCSTAVTVGISTSNSSFSAVSGGSAQTWSTQSHTYTYTLTGTSVNTMYYLYDNKSGKNAQVASLTLTYEPASCNPPTFLPAAGAYTSTQSVTISSTTDGATIYYTTDGTTPTTSSLTEQPVSVATSMTIKAIAVKAGLANSSVADAAYTISQAYNLTITSEHGTPTVTVNSSPVTPIAGVYSIPQGATVNLSASAASNWVFDNWTVNSGGVTISNNAFVMPDGDVSITANYIATTTYTFDFTSTDYFYTTASGNEHPSTGNSNNYDEFYSASNRDRFTASGTNHYFNSGYFLFGKSGATVGLPSFEGYKIIKVVLHSSNSGSQSVGVSIVNGSGTTVASAQTWSSRDKDYTYTIPSEYQKSPLKVNITNDNNAQFTSISIVCVELPSYELTIESPSNGTFTVKDKNDNAISSGTNVKEGALVKLAATPADGYVLEAFSVTKAGSGSVEVTMDGNNGTFNMPDDAVTVNATFVAKITLTYKANGGTGDDVVEDYASGTNVELKDGSTLFTAPSAQHYFLYWTKNADGSGTQYSAGSEYELSENTTLYANWSNLYNVAVSSVDNVVISASYGVSSTIAEGENANVAYGTTITLNHDLGAGKTFIWDVYKTSDSETKVTVENNSFTVPAYGVTVSGEIKDVYIITFDVNGNTAVVDPVNVIEGNSIDLTDNTYQPSMAGYTFKGWSETNGSATTIATPATYTPTASKTLYAVFKKVTGESDFSVTTSGMPTSYPTSETGYTLSGHTFKLYNVANYSSSIQFKGSAGYMFNTEDFGRITEIVLNYSSYKDLDIFVSENSQHPTTTEITPTNVENVYTFNLSGGNYHYFTIKYGTSNAANLTSIDITYESSSDVIFVNSACTKTSIAAGEIVNVGANGILTLTGANFGNASNLIIEDGGQLITNSSIPLTYKKQITSAAKDGGWYTISTPVHTASNTFLTPGSVENLILDPATNYDFFYYDEASHTWINYKQGAFNLNIGQGYLYRNNGAELHFAGYSNQATSYDVDLSYSSTEPNLLGFNLIGNPYPQNITMSDVTVNNGGTLSGGYVLSKDGAWSADVAATIKPAQGFLVQINKTGVTATISKPAGGAKSRSERDYLKFIVANSQYEDATFALFEEGYGLNKIDHRNSDVPMLYIPKDRDIFAIATMDNSTQSFNLNFKAKTTGKYTLTYEATGELSYLHVIDRLTGEDVDMLLEGEYSFIASPSDNENRFIVNMRHSNNAENSENSIFAYQNGNDIVVNGEGEMQIFDVMGRMVGSQRINGVETINIPLRGVYIFRLNEKTQKIVVE